MSKDTEPSGVAEITVEEAGQQFPRQWILMRVTKHDEYGDPSAGELLLHSKIRGAISKRLRREPAATEQKRPLYIFHAGPHRLPSFM